MNGNHLLSEIRVSTTASGYNRLRLQYGYDSFANVKTLNELYNNSGGASFTFSYDDANRVTNAFGRTYTWQGTGNFAAFEGTNYTYDSVHRHAVNKVANVDRFDYNANGNMTVRNKGLSSAQTLAWNSENRLVSVTGNGVSEQYAYSPDGQRVKKVSNGNTTYYINGYYEVEVAATTTTGVAAAAVLDADQESTDTLMPGADFDFVSAGRSTQSVDIELPSDYLATQAASVDAGSANSGCVGRTTTGSTNWQSYGSSGLYLDVDTSQCGFTGTPVYITALGGSSSHWSTTGATSIYGATKNGFRVYVKFVNGSGITPQQANNWNWHIEWMALPSGTAASGQCSGQTSPGNTAWQQYGAGIYVDVATSGCGFGATPIYATSLGGSSAHWLATGATAIYQPTQNGFRVYVRRADGVSLTTAQANGWNWHINWTGSAASTVTPGLCAGKTVTGNTNWQSYGSAAIYLDVNTSGCGNQAIPVYATSLGGSSAHYMAVGATSIYQPTQSGFRVYVRRSDGAGLTPAQANGMNWHINWTAVPETAVTKYYYFGNQRVAMAKGGEFRYLHGDHLDSTVMETNLSGAVITDQKYYAFGRQRDSGPVTTEHKFTGQKLDGSGLYYYNARYYDPTIGQFVSPDTLVPDPEQILAYNRYMYALGNPLTYSDPSGYYTNDEIMQHYGCEGWACVESHFGSGGSHDGLWGWLYTLQQAQDGYEVHASSFSGPIGMTQFSGVFHRGANGTIGVQGTNFSAQVGNEGIKTFNIDRVIYRKSISLLGA